MSFKVYNGVKFKTKDWFELKEQLRNIKKDCVELANNTISVNDIEILDMMKHKEFREAITNDNFGLVWKMMCEEIRERKVYAPLFNFSICVYPYEDGTLYGVVFADAVTGFHESIESYLDEFGYWDSTDTHEGISDEDWEERSKVWHKIFDNCYHYNDAGFTYDIVTYRDLSIIKVKEALEKYLGREIKI